MMQIKGLTSIRGFWQWLAIFLTVDLILAIVQTAWDKRHGIGVIALFTAHAPYSLLLAALFKVMARKNGP
jgi:hypothetical protein